MKIVEDIGLADVQAEYGSPEGDLAELIMGEQVHIGGMHASTELAERAGIEPGTSGVDLCCCTGAGMRFLVRYRGAAHMIGVDATERIVRRGQDRCREEGLDDRVIFVLGDACDTGLPDASADFVWGEDAWCYVADKSRLIAEAARLVRPGGTIAFTDWVEGPVAMEEREAEQFLRFMNFPSILSIDDYRRLLEREGCAVEAAEDTGRFARYFDLYRDMLTLQLTYDALRIVGFDTERMQAAEAGRELVRKLGKSGKVGQALFVARKPPPAARSC